MTSNRIALFTLGLALAAVCSVPRADGIDYPDTRRIDHTDNYHGTVVADPYRWLEDDVRESEAVADWVSAQNEVTFAYLRQLPGRESIQQRLETLWNYAKFLRPWKEGGRYYFRKNDGLQNQYVLYTMDSLEDDPRILIDPNTWSEDGTVAMAGMQASPDGRHFAYGVQDGGSDWRTWRVMEIDSGEVLEDEIKWVKFNSPAWTSDGEGFFYARFPELVEGVKYQDLNTNAKLYYHRLGTPQTEDTLVFEAPENPAWVPVAEVTDDGRYLVITVFKGTDDRYRIFYRDLSVPDSPVVPLVENFEHEYTFVGSSGSTFFFVTNRDAGLRRIVSVEVAGDGERQWSEVVPETQATLVGADLVGQRLLARYLEDAKSRVTAYGLNGARQGDVELPGIGSASGFTGRADDHEVFYYFSSFTTPPSTYRYDVDSGESTLLQRDNVDFNPDDYVVSQVFYRSKDGTRVPMFLSHRKDVKTDRANPTLLYGYGGFDIPLTPGFSVSNLAWMEMGGIYAVANLRGGGEYGQAWHKAGTKLQKQNVFDDFIAAAEWLIDNGYTTREKLAIRGGSNGGLLVGAVMTQRPELFAAALPAVGVMDMLRFHRFTAGRFWVDDYGSADNAEEFKALYAYSPYHNLAPGKSYPATLVTTADLDDRVVPGHSFKFAAALQNAQAGDAPVLIRIETRAGHGAGTPTSKRIEEAADLWSFLAQHLGMN